MESRFVRLFSFIQDTNETQFKCRPKNKIKTQTCKSTSTNPIISSYNVKAQKENKRNVKAAQRKITERKSAKKNNVVIRI